jgi:hypothetical protein
MANNFLCEYPIEYNLIYTVLIVYIVQIRMGIITTIDSLILSYLFNILRVNGFLILHKISLLLPCV